METITLSMEAAATLRVILEFHAMNDEADAGYYDRESFEELCAQCGVAIFPVEKSSAETPDLFDASIDKGDVD